MSGEEAKVADGVRCPYCGALRIHREGYTGRDTQGGIHRGRRCEV